MTAADEAAATCTAVSYYAGDRGPTLHLDFQSHEALYRFHGLVVELATGRREEADLAAIGPVCFIDVGHLHLRRVEKVHWSGAVLFDSTSDGGQGFVWEQDTGRWIDTACRTLALFECPGGHQEEGDSDERHMILVAYREHRPAHVNEAVAAYFNGVDDAA